MAQSTTSVQYAELNRVIARFVFGATTTSVGASAAAGDETIVVDDIIRRGYRKFLMPPPLPGDNYVHVWSFLKKKASLDVRSLQTGTFTTAATDNSGLKVIDTAGTFTTRFEGHNDDDGESLIDKTVTATDVSTGTKYTSIITGVTSATELVNAPAWNAALSSTSDTYTIGPADWDLPEDFGAMIGDMTYRERTTYPPLKLVGSSRIRQLRQDAGLVTSDRPKVVAIRSKSQATESGSAQSGADEGVRWEVMFWPDPDAEYTFEYDYWVSVDEITSALAFPTGAMHGGAIMAACMWVAQEYADPQNAQFNMHDRFIEALRASIMFDRQLHGGEFGKYNADNSDLQNRVQPFRDRVSNVTVGGTQYPT